MTHDTSASMANDSGWTAAPFGMEYGGTPEGTRTIQAQASPPELTRKNFADSAQRCGKSLNHSEQEGQALPQILPATFAGHESRSCRPSIQSSMGRRLRLTSRIGPVVSPLVDRLLARRRRAGRPGLLGVER